MKITAGSTNISLNVYFVDDDGGTAPGEPTTGLLFSDIETGGSASYARQGAARVDVTLKTLASASTAYDEGGFILIDDTNMPGLYRVDIPDAAFAAGVSFVTIHMVAAGANNTIIRPLLVDIDPIPALIATAQADLDTITGAAGALLDSTATSPQLVDDILDEVNTGAAHNVTNSLGKQIRAVANKVAYEGTVNDAGASTTVFIIDSGASSVDDFYKEQTFTFTDGALAGQSRIVFGYTGASRTVTFDEALTSAPANGVGILISADHVHAITEITADIDASSTQLAAIVLDTGTNLPALLPAALVGGRIDADVGGISTSATAADNLEASTLGIVATTVNDAGASTTAFIITSGEDTDDHFNGRIITFTSGALDGQSTDITDYTGATKAVTVTALTEAPANGVSFVIT